MKPKFIFVLAAMAAVLGALTAPARGVFVTVFSGAFWFAVALAIGYWSRVSRRPTRREISMPTINQDEWTDEQGVNRFHGDVFDYAVHRHPGDDQEHR